MDKISTKNVKEPTKLAVKKSKRGPYKKRWRFHLMENEVHMILEACEKSYFPLRNKLLILMAYNHGLRASELCALKWHNVDIANRRIYITRMKNGKSGYHPIESDLEYNLFKEHKAIRDKQVVKDPFVFMSERRRPITPYSPRCFNALCEQLGNLAGLDFKFTPHMLRHGIATWLVENDMNIVKVSRFMGHSKLSSTERYLHISAKQYQGYMKGSIFA